MEEFMVYLEQFFAQFSPVRKTTIFSQDLWAFTCGQKWVVEIGKSGDEYSLVYFTKKLIDLNLW